MSWARSNSPSHSEIASAWASSDGGTRPVGQAGPSYFIDFRSAPPDVGQWLAHPKLMRDADEGFTDEESLEVPFPPGAYDAMFYVARSTPLARLSPPPPID